MKLFLKFCLFFSLLSSSALAQTIGVPTAIPLPGGVATQTLRLDQNDYELILHSRLTNEPDTARTFSYSVSFANAKKWATTHAVVPAQTERDLLEQHLRQKESNLIKHLRSIDRRPQAHKQTLQQTTRTFAFESFGGVTSNQTIAATQISSNNRAIAYIDNGLPVSEKNITTTNIQAMMDRFSSATYPAVTQLFGAPSDIDNDGKVIFLFTHWVDRVGGIAGFYASSALFSKTQGGDGNLADMMFISPTQDLATYESLLAHEFQHLINFNQHFLLRNGDAESSWLNEGLSHVTEDLVGGHIAGGNPDLIFAFMAAPERYSLTGEALLNLGVRGAAYMFVRGLMEEFGNDVPGRLVKTDLTGIANVEKLTGQPFSTTLQNHLSRLFLSGNNLTAETSFNYRFSYLTESQTGHRSFPIPSEHVLNAQSISGTLKPAAAVYLRLTGTTTQTIHIQTESSGNIQGTFIALPKNFQPTISLPIDYFQSLTLDKPLSGTFVAGENTVFSGTTTSPSPEQILISFTPKKGSAEGEFSFSAPVTNGRFSTNLIFAPTQAGHYKLDVYAGTKGQLLPHKGGFPSVTIQAGTGSVHLPIDFFSGITLNAPLPAQYTAGTGSSLSGKVTDASIDVLVLVLTSLSTQEKIRIQTSVTNGTFRKGFVFTPDQAGSYDLSLFGGPSGGSLPHLGSFSPITIKTSSTDSVTLPVDFFDHIVLDAPLNATFVVGQNRNISGQATDAGITQVGLSFSPTSGGSDIDKFVDVTQGRFTADFSFANVQNQPYVLTLYGGKKGQNLPFLGSFSPIRVVSAPSTQTPSPDFDGNGTVGFSDFLQFAGAFGTRKGNTGFNAKFDLDSDGAIGFGDFLIFAGSFGKSATG